MMSMKLQTPPYLAQMLQARTCYVTWHETPCLENRYVSFVDFWLKTDYQSVADERLVGSEIYSNIDFVVDGPLDYRELSFSLLFNKPTELAIAPVPGTALWRFESLYRQDVSFCCEVSWLGTGYNPNRRTNKVKVRKATDSPNTIEIELDVWTQDGLYSRQYFFLYGDFVPE